MKYSLSLCYCTCLAWFVQILPELEQSSFFEIKVNHTNTCIHVMRICSLAQTCNKFIITLLFWIWHICNHLVLHSWAFGLLARRLQMCYIPYWGVITHTYVLYLSKLKTGVLFSNLLIPSLLFIHSLVFEHDHLFFRTLNIILDYILSFTMPLCIPVTSC